MTLSDKTLRLAAEALDFWLSNLDGEEDPGFADALVLARLEIDGGLEVAHYRVNFGEGWVYFEDAIAYMETEDNLVYVACGRGHDIVQISGCLRGEHDDVIDSMKAQYGDDIVIDGPWFPFDRREKGES